MPAIRLGSSPIGARVGTAGSSGIARLGCVRKDSHPAPQGVHRTPIGPRTVFPEQQ